MKTKHKSCVAAAAVAAGAGEKMKSVILYPYGPLTGTGCCRILHAKNLAITSAIYTINISLLIVLIYSWRININIHESSDLEDVYYGVQIAYFAIIGTQMSMIVLSIMLLFGIIKENPGLIVPWIIGYITFMALEAVAMVYSNVLRDHVNKIFLVFISIIFKWIALAKIITLILKSRLQNLFFSAKMLVGLFSLFKRNLEHLLSLQTKGSKKLCKILNNYILIHYYF